MSARLHTVLLAGVLLLAAKVHAAPGRIPPLSVEPTAPEQSFLAWHHGSKLTGTLAGANQGHLAWKSSLFTEAMRAQRKAVARVDFAGQPAAEQGPFRFILTDGSHLTGEWKSLDPQSLVMADASGRELTIRREALVAVERITGSGLLAAGPADLLLGKPVGKGRVEKLPPVPAPGGQVAFLDFNAGVTRKLDLPERCLVALRLRVEDKPDFTLELAGTGGWLTLETWGDELVLSRGMRFASSGPLALRDDGRLDLRLAWDSAAGRAVLFASDGKTLAELKTEPSPSPAAILEQVAALFPGHFGRAMQQALDHPETIAAIQRGGRPRGLTLVNKGAGFVVEHYTISAWEGDTPPTIPSQGAGLATARQWLAGEPVSCDGLTVTLRNGRDTHEVPLDTVRSLRWHNQTAEPPANPPGTEVWLHDGGLVRGNLLESAADTIKIATGFSPEPLAVSLERCRAVVFPGPGPDGEPAPDLDTFDRLAAGGQSLPGTIVPTNGTLPSFHPLGCETPLAPAPAHDLTLTRALPAGRQFQRAAALLHTTSNESLPVSAVRIEPGQLHFAREGEISGQVAVSQLHAVQFAPPAVTMEAGFETAGWEFLGTSGARPRYQEDAIVLPPGSGLGHPSLLHGSDFRFEIASESQMTSLRVRLFCQGTDRTSDSLNFLIAHYGRQIHSGLERGRDGRFSSSRTIEVDSDLPAVPVEFRFSGGKVELFINEIFAVRSDLADRKKTTRKTGAGLVIETASAWGNRIGPAKVSNFAMRGSPSLVSPPPFSPKGKEESLLLPRLRREPPPRHILIGRNGDLLRGEIGETTATTVPLRVGLNNYQLPLDRLAAIVWVAEPDQEMEANLPKKTTNEEAEAEAPGETAPRSEPAEPPPPAEVDPRPQWLDLTNGGRLQLTVERWDPQGVAGHHPILGRCVFPPDQVHRLALEPPPPEGALAALSGWKFRKTVDPKPPGIEEVDVSPLVGQPAPDLTLPMLEGEPFSISKSRGKVVVLDFWATWCAPCVRSLPPLIEAMSTFPEDQVVFVAINEGESKARVQRFLETRQLRMPVAFDSDLEAGRMFEAEAIPYTVVIDPAGMVSHVSMGAEPEGEKKIAEAVSKALEAHHPAADDQGPEN